MDKMQKNYLNLHIKNEISSTKYKTGYFVRTFFQHIQVEDLKEKKSITLQRIKK